MEKKKKKKVVKLNKGQLWLAREDQGQGFLFLSHDVGFEGTGSGGGRW